MTLRSGRVPRIGARLAVLLGVPLVVFAAWIGVAWLVVSGEDPEAQLRQQAERLQGSFSRLLDAGADVAGRALQATPQIAFEEARSGPWKDRLEGVGLVDGEGWIEWAGTPAEPPGDVGDRSWRTFSEGQRVRLVYTTAVARDGHFALASFILDTPLEDLPFRMLLPRGVDPRILQNVDFLDGRREHGDVIETFGNGDGVYRGEAPSTLHYPLRSPAGEILALARFQTVPADYRFRTARGLATAAAAAVFALLLATAFPWRSIARGSSGLVLSVAAIVVARIALAVTRAPAHLLPRGTGSPSVYGSPRPWGLISSPADFLLTCVAVLLVVLAIREFCMASDERRRWIRVTLCAVTGLAAAALSVYLSFSLARDAQIPLQLLEKLEPPLAHLCLLIGLAALLVAAAEATAALWVVAMGRAGTAGGRGLERSVAALCLVPLAVLSTTVFANSSDHLARDRLRTEFMPQVLEQSSRRMLALRAFVADAAEKETTLGAVLAPPSGRDPYAAYRLWASGELFQLGYQSSLQLYDASGELISHFGFDLPPLVEPVDLTTASATPRMIDEVIPLLSVEQEVLHAEMAVTHRGAVVGAVVGHVLDEPGNLSFLPPVGPYLAALGPGAHQEPENLPDYVLYDDDGTVLLSSIRRPPAMGEELLDLASREAEISIMAGGEWHTALPRMGGGRLHLLLIPSRPILDRFAVSTKLFLLSFLLLTAIELLRSVRRHRGVPSLFKSLRESFYRKLLIALLIASLLPLLLLALVLMGYVESRAEGQLVDSAAQIVQVVQRVIRDYAAIQSDDPRLTDEVLDWLRNIVDQDIHIYEDGVLAASSKRELFTSGLLNPRLPGEVQRQVVEGGLPYLTLDTRMGPSEISVAYADVALPGSRRHVVAAVPLILQREEAARAVERIEEMLFLSTVLLAALLVAVASFVARTVARPVRDLVDATGRIASGDYTTRLETRSRDEVAELVEKFNVMAKALADQRADLVRRRDYMEALLANATTGVISTDDRGRIVTLNPAAADLLAFSGRSRIGDDLVEAVSSEGRLEPLARVLGSHRAGRGVPLDVDLTDPTDPRRLRFVRVELPDPAGGNPGSLILLEDVTDMMRSSQLAAWAEMARAIAHEIKNPLTPIQLSTQHLEQLLRDRGALPSPEIESCLETVIKQVNELRDIASEFSSYAKLPVMTPEFLEPAALMREAVAPYLAAPPPGVKFEERYDEAPPVLVDRRVLTRAIVNLVENAIQAMPDGGTLTLSTGVDERSSGVVLRVQDTGTGIAPEVRARLFEPYFSTKTSGAGLGLAIVRRAVEAHGGSIDVVSDGRRGTTFRIVLPVMANEKA